MSKMLLACCKVMLYIFAVMWIFWSQNTVCARTDRRCTNLLRRLLKNPPNNTKIAINIGLSKARYLCREGFKLVGQELRTCKRGRWTDNNEPKCMRPCGKPEDIPHSKIVVGSSFNYNDQLRYRCKEGYQLNGPRLRTCGEDGKWSEAPTCKERLSCGERAVNVRAKIVGGETSQRGMWPWQIGIYRGNRNASTFICGGSLVSRQWVLTAAHCFYLMGIYLGSTNLHVIKAGDHNLSISEPSQQEVVPDKIFVHPRFKPRGVPFFDGDIALVKLSQELELSEYVRTVCLPAKDEGDPTIPKAKGTVAGWGVTRALDRHERPSRNDIPEVLRHATFTIQSNQLCLNKSGIQYNATTAFCAGDGKGGKDTCAGDSGGAFVQENSGAKWVAIGVVSWGNGCAQQDQYGYYTRVYPFLDWIKKTMGQDIVTENARETENSCSSNTERRGIDLNEECGLDLVLVFDASVSVRRHYFKTSLEFAKELLRVIGASKRAGNIRVAAVTEAKLEFNLGDSNVDTIDKAIKAIDNILYVGWVSSYIRALKIVKNQVAPNVRKDSHHVMMFITDGLEPSRSLRREVRYLRDEKHFEVYAIGIGLKVNTPALKSIASAIQDHNHVIPVRQYKNLQEAVKGVLQIDAEFFARCVPPCTGRGDLDYSVCGVSPVDLRARMVGGKSSKRGWWPWHIGLYHTTDEGRLQVICGGALLSSRWVLTVAHCFYHFNPIFGKYMYKGNPARYKVKAGDHNLKKVEKSQQEVIPERIFVHREYVDSKFVNNIALIKLRQKVELSSFVRPLCLPEKDDGDLAIPMKYGIATGWGATQALKPGERPDPKKQYSTRLQFSAFTIQSDQLCANRSVLQPFNSTVAFCAGDGKGGNDTCHGDSGGAFIREAKRGDDYRWVATGLVSWGNGCAQKNEYGYYTRVYPFTDWIKKTMKDNTEPEEE